jgi:hypothetical protein
MLCPQKKGEISIAKTQMASCALCTKSNMCYESNTKWFWYVWHCVGIYTWLLLEPILGNYVGATWQLGNLKIFPTLHNLHI